MFHLYLTRKCDSYFITHIKMIRSISKHIPLVSIEVHRKTDTLFSGNNITAAGFEPLTF